MNRFELYDKYLRFLHHPQGYLSKEQIKEREKFKRELGRKINE